MADTADISAENRDLGMLGRAQWDNAGRLTVGKEREMAVERTPEELEQALSDSDGLFERFADGDLHALPSLIEAMTGAKVVSHSVHEPVEN